MPKFAIFVSSQSRHWYLGGPAFRSLEDIHSEDEAVAFFQTVDPPSGSIVELVEVDYAGTHKRVVARRLAADLPDPARETPR